MCHTIRDLHNYQNLTRTFRSTVSCHRKNLKIRQAICFMCRPQFCASVCLVRLATQWEGADSIVVWLVSCPSSADNVPHIYGPVHNLNFWNCSFNLFV